jgi:hypothetical protein
VKGAGKQETDALAALNNLLAEDFHTITWEQEKPANAALRENPSHWQLICAVRRWAAALMGVWRSYSGRCAQIHEAGGAEDPSIEAMATLLNALSAHLGLPSGSFLSGENWPESNGVRRFVLRVVDASVELVEGELITHALLPKWESPSIQVLAARCFGPPELAAESAPDPQQQQDTQLLSADESNEVFLRLEKSFRDAVIDDVDVPYWEAVLAVFQAKAKEGVAVPQVDNSSGGGLHQRARRKMGDPAANPEMDAKEVMVALGLSKSAVYEHPRLDRVSTGIRAVRFTTKSVLALKDSAPE